MCFTFLNTNAPALVVRRFGTLRCGGNKPSPIMSEQTLFGTEIESILSSWEATKDTIQTNPAILEAATPGVSVEQIDEVVKTLCNWAGRVRSPNGFKPVFPFARVQLSLLMTSLCTHAANMAGNPAAHITSFLNQLIACFVPLSCATMFSEKDERLRGVLEVHAELEQSIALMGTAQHELAGKLQKLTEVQAVADEIHQRGEKVTTIESEAVTAGGKISELLTEAAERVDEIEDTRTSAAEVKEQCDKLLTENEALKVALSKQSADFAAFLAKSQQQLKELHEQAISKKELIDSLLSGATSSALATAFSRGKKRYVVGQWVWGIGFLIAVGALFGMGWSVEKAIPAGQGAGDVWIYLAHRIPLAAPMIWFGWFCSMQYGNVIRLMEDYAFKEATSIAFAGYRDHMEHLSGVSDGEASNALERLALVTISVLGNEPLRLLQKQHQDASPMDKLLSGLKSLKSGKTAKAADSDPE